MNRAAALFLFAVWLAGCTEASKPKPPTKAASEAPLVVPAGEGIRVHVDFSDAVRHRMVVTATYPAGEGDLVVAMPVWSPGSYLVREYARHIETFAAFDSGGETLEFEKLSKNRRRVKSGGQQVTLRYTLYAREASVRTNFVDADMAVFIPSASVFWDVARPELPFVLQFKKPDAWRDVQSQLSPQGDAWTAANYTALVDSPVVLGRAELTEFEVYGVKHRLATFGGEGRFPHVRAAEDLPALIKTTIDLFGDVPYTSYVFLNVVNEGRGGLEHDNSTLLMTSRFVGETEASYRKWLGLASHEFFHVWNVRRLRPKGLLRLNLEEENYTRDLWVSEGVTSYYDDLLLRRAGLITEAEYLEVVSELFTRLWGDHGYQRQSLADASFDAWIRYYRPHEASRDTTVSYYVKGAALAFVLDAALREASDGRYCLDDVLRAAWKRYRKTGFTSDEWFGLFKEFGSDHVEDLARRGALTTEKLDADTALAGYGLRFKSDVEPKDEEARRKNAWLGVELGGRGGLEVTRVRSSEPAEAAGINVGDELIALDGLRLNSNNVLAHHGPGDVVDVLLARRGVLRTVTATIGAKPKLKWKVELSPSAPLQAKRRRLRWLLSE